MVCGRRLALSIKYNVSIEKTTSLQLHKKKKNIYLSQLEFTLTLSPHSFLPFLKAGRYVSYSNDIVGYSRDWFYF